MKIAKLFQNGRSQAVRLPKECRFTHGEKEVYVHMVDGMIMLFSKANPWGPLFKSLEKFTPDFMEGRDQALKSELREDFS